MGRYIPQIIFVGTFIYVMSSGLNLCRTRLDMGSMTKFG